MYATIVFGILIIVFIICFLISLYEVDEDGYLWAIPTAVCVAGLMASLFLGMSITKRKDLTDKKQYIEYCLENNPNYYMIEEASKYNKNVELGNNLWCRFTIEDRTEYIIDIDKYIGDNK